MTELQLHTMGVSSVAELFDPCDAQNQKLI